MTRATVEARSRGILVVRVATAGISVAWAGEKKSVSIKETQDILVTIARVIGSRHPEGVFLRGMPRRFSESRALAVILNTLRFAWRIPVAHDATGRIRRAERMMEILSETRIPLLPCYSGEPNITTPRHHSP